MAEQVRTRSSALRRPRYPWYFLVPAGAFYLFVVIVPSLQGVFFSFTEWKALTPPQFLGIDHYLAMFSDARAFGALVRTLILGAGITVLQVGIGLLLALGVNSRIKSRNVLRVFLFAPAIVLPVAVAFLWRYLFAPRGAINTILEALSLDSLTHDWLGDRNTALVAVIVVVVWQFAGYSMVIFLANLQGVDPHQLEAAAIDGTNAVQRFWWVVRPELTPAFVVTIILALTSALKLFDQVWVLTQGGPGFDTENMSVLIYRTGFQYGNLGYGTAMAVVLAVVVVIISTLQFRVMRRMGS